VSYSTLRRFAVDVLDWRKREPTVLIEDAPPGVEAQADFGKMGMVVDPTTGKRRALYALIVTLGLAPRPPPPPPLPGQLGLPLAG